MRVGRLIFIAICALLAVAFAVVAVIAFIVGQVLPGITISCDAVLIATTATILWLMELDYREEA